MAKFDNWNDDDEPEEEEETDNSSASGTHIYFGQEGYDRIPAPVEASDEAMSAVEKAYYLVGTKPECNGNVRDFAANYWEGGIHHMLADFVIAVGEVDETREFTPLVELALDDLPQDLQMQTLAQYLGRDENEELAKELYQALGETEHIAEAAEEAEQTEEDTESE